MKNKVFKLTAIALAMAFLAGCAQNQILKTLEASVTAAEMLIAALQVSGRIDPAVAYEIETAIEGLPLAYQETAAELSSADTAAVKAAKIASYYASTVAALQTLPPPARFYAAAIAASIQAFLSNLPQASAQAARFLARSRAASANDVRFDANRLNAIGRRAALLSAELAELRTEASRNTKEETR
jgi:hypothetical protein